MKQFKIGEKAWVLRNEKIEEHEIQSKFIIAGVEYLMLDGELHPEELCFDSLHKALDADEGRTFKMYK